MRRHRLLLVVGGLIVAAIAFAGMTGVASAADVQHGISFTKGCQSPTQVGAGYSCTYSIRNNVDEAQDTLTINGLNDTVHAASGNVSSGNVFTSLKFEIAAGSPTCTGGTGNGSPGNPFTGASSCTLPFGSRLNVQSFSFYTVQASDFNLPGHILTDSAELTWHDLCNDPAGTGNSNCVNNPPISGAGSQTVVNGLPSTTATTIHNAAHGAVTTVAVGTTVHDLVTVSGGAGNPTPTGTVRIDWFTNNTCAGAPTATSAALPLVGGSIDATSFPQTPSTVGGFGFKAHYLGDPANPIYTVSDGPCEPLNTVDANIQITPANATNPVGTTHVLTITVNGLGGNIDAGPHTATASIVSGPGSFVGSPTCTYTGGAASASCTVTITSSTAGTTVVSATSDIPVSGVTITRVTDGSHGSSGPATKLWVAPQANVRTDVHNAAHGVITTAAPGDVVHDKAFVTKAAGTPAGAPAPTGNVKFHRYSTLNCTGASVDETVPLAVDGTAESSTFTVTDNISYRAEYLGDANYASVQGACEPLQVQTSVCPACPPPAAPCPAFPVFPGQPGPGGPCSFDVLDTSVKGTLVEVTIQNLSSNGDAAMTKLHVTWPAANGALKSVSMNGYLYTGPPLVGGSADLTFTTDPLTRTIKVGQSEKLRLIFEKSADTNTAHYTASVEFGTCVIPIFP